MTQTSFSQDGEYPEWMRGYSPAQRDRLTQLLDLYLSKLEAGERLTLQELVDDDEFLKEPLQRYIEQIDQLYQPEPKPPSRTAVSMPRLEFGSEGEPKHLGDFQLLREVGRGGMGVVYEAIQESLGRRVALKLLPLAAMFSANQVARFRNEVQAAAMLQHPNIVPVYAVGVEKGIHFYAMPFIEGQSWRKWFRNCVMRHHRRQYPMVAADDPFRWQTSAALETWNRCSRSDSGRA